MIGLDIGSIVDLGTLVAQSGTLRAVEYTADEVFLYVIDIVLLIYEMDPGG